MRRVENIMATSRISVVGVGDGGCNAVDSMATHWENGPSLIAINTDAQALKTTQASTRLQIGEQITRNMGAGGDANMGALSANDDFDTLQGLFRGMDLIFLVATLGGGTGTGATPVVARAARETGAMVIAFVTLPFTFEGDRRMSQARQGLLNLQDQADVVIVIPNQALFAAAGSNATAEEAFHQSDYYLGMGIFAIWKLLTQRGIINLDFATLRMVARCSGGASSFSYGEGKGSERAQRAIQTALHSPLLDNGETLLESESILVSILGGSDMSIREVESIMSAVESATRKDAHIHMGTSIDDSWNDAISVTIVASRFWRAENESDEKTPPDPAVPEESPTTPAGKKKNRKTETTQSQLIFEGISKGLFKDVEPTIIAGEDMDVPTFIRRRVAVSK
ncbi:MAG: cell division protein FtsZ [bacterium]|jgi:cell division protein FtsZ